MKLSWNEIYIRALSFSKKWKDARDEAAEAQSFLNEFFDVFGIDRKRIATFESKVPMGKSRNGYIDLLWKGVILIEMKSIGKSLDKAYRQAKDYAFNLEDQELPEYIMVSDFKNIRIYRNRTGQVWTFKTSQLHEKVKIFSDLAGYKTSSEMPTDKEVDIKAAQKMAKLHDILKSHGYEGHNLEVYLVRLLFCLFSDDTGIFEKNIFYDYISNSKEDGSDLSSRIAKLFEVLDMSLEQRVKQTMLSEELKRFEYINGGLFREKLPFADFNYQMRKMLLECCSVDWGYISPAIFGSIFQGVMHTKERRELGAHYTSEKNILKLIKPLFLDELWKEFEHIKGSSKQLKQFHKKLSNLKFLDSACGCGNFLIITYRELRRLELEVLKMLIDSGGQLVMDISPYCKVNVNQFYGIEYEEFPAQIAQVGMWLIDHQMNTLVAEHFGLYYARLPLRQSATIIYGNALTTDWESVVSKYELSYILGNPPFVGKKYQNKRQKEDMIHVFGKKFKGVGKLDYVSGWYKKAADFIKNTNIRVAFVSTNSIVQGEQVSILWKPLFEDNLIHFDFTYRTFVWANEAKGNAAVHCVIIGFSQRRNTRAKLIFEGDTIVEAKNINAYLVDAPNVFVEARSKAICDVPKMSAGNKPDDYNHLKIEEIDYNDFIKDDPSSTKYLKRMMGASEFINNKNRYCLWLINCPPNELKQMPKVRERVEACRKARMDSGTPEALKLSETPKLFREAMNPSSYLILPAVSSERRKYIPIGFQNQDVIPVMSVLIIPNANLYHFGVLTSSIHMAWMRAVCGRMKSDYRYSKNVVYNTFPWPNSTRKSKKNIENAAQNIIDVRALYPDSSLADLYDPLTMPPELVKAHKILDKTVKTAYGGKGYATEAERVADLMERYHELTK